jgi:hypothetical protein
LRRRDLADTAPGKFLHRLAERSKISRELLKLLLPGLVY